MVAVADDGGSSGRLRAHLGIPPPGDLRRCLSALADPSSLLGARFVTLEPADPLVAPEVVEAILSADQVVLGPGSLYTSVLAAAVFPVFAALWRPLLRNGCTSATWALRNPRVWAATHSITFGPCNATAFRSTSWFASQRRPGYPIRRTKRRPFRWSRHRWPGPTAWLTIPRFWPRHYGAATGLAPCGTI